MCDVSIYKPQLVVNTVRKYYLIKLNYSCSRCSGGQSDVGVFKTRNGEIAKWRNDEMAKWN